MSYIPLIAKVESLPPLPESTIKIEELFAQGEPDIDKLVKIIEHDPVLTTDVLSKVNAPLYGFSKNIVSILQAVTLFGATQMRAMILASTIHRNFNIDLSPYGVTTAEFAKTSLMQSELIFQWYMGVNINLARALTPIAFIMQTGSVLIAKEVIENSAVEAFMEDLNKFENIADTEILHTMMSTAQINTIIFRHLHLNETFSECMRYLDNEQEAPPSVREMVEALQIIRTAINLKEQLTEHSLEQALELIKKYHYNPDSFLRAVKRVQNKYLD